MTVKMSEEKEFPLHECVFEGDLCKLSTLIHDNDIAKKDKHGNTALHLAAMLGRRGCAYLLASHGAPVKIKNLAGWSPLAEAISYGDRQTIAFLVRTIRAQARRHIRERRPNLVSALMNIQDFYMELKWDFHSWVPLVSRILPSDICKIYKSGARIRLDTTLVDFTDMKWERGDISFIFLGEKEPAESLIIFDNKAKVYQLIKQIESEREIEDEVDILMSSDILAAQMSTKGISFSKAQSGWIFREDRKELIAGTYNSTIYTINGLVLESRKRREHLTRDDLQKNKAIIETLTRGNMRNLNSMIEPTRRPSLNPPPQRGVDWNAYISAEAGQYPGLGREIVYKESSKNFKATVAMSDDFPLSVSMLLSVLEVVGPFKHFAKLRDFVAMKLPTGFPVKVDIPVLPTVTAKVTFQKFEFRDDINADMFKIPDDYMEDPQRFPEL